jgi:AcrR family transcriptional regulator
VTGLRERKKQKTKASIQREALRLFKKHGYEETTIEDIAEAAEISPSTFFNYFPSKEEVVIYDEYDPQVFAALMQHRHGERLSTSMRRLIAELSKPFAADAPSILERAKLSLEVPELRGRIWGELERTRDIFSQVIADRTGREVADFESQVVSMAFVAAVFQASIQWVKDDGRGDFLELISRAMEIVGVYELLDRLEQPAS